MLKAQLIFFKWRSISPSSDIRAIVETPVGSEENHSVSGELASLEPTFHTTQALLGQWLLLLQPWMIRALQFDSPDIPLFLICSPQHFEARRRKIL